MFKNINLDKITLTVTLFIGGILSAGVFFLSLQVVGNDKNLEFYSLANEHAAALQSKFDALSEILHGFVGLFAASNFVDENEFVTFFEEAFPEHTEIKILSWIPYTKEPGHKQSQFTILEYNKSGALVPAATREAYYSFAYVYQRDGFERQIHLDAGNFGHYKKILHQARDSGLIKSTQQVPDSPGKHQLIEMIIPIYKVKQIRRTVEQRRESILGFVSVVVDIKTAVGIALQNHSPDPEVETYILDATNNDNIVHYHSMQAPIKPPYFLPANIESGVFSASNSVLFASEQWKIGINPVSSAHNPYFSIMPWLNLAIGMIITIIISAFIHKLQQKKFDIEQQVNNRTAALSDSHEQYRAVVKTVVDGIITINRHGTVQSFNPSAESIFGFSSDEVIGNNINLLMPEPYHSEHNQYLDNFIQTKNAKIIGIGREVTGKRKNGSVFPMDLAVSEMNIGNEKLFTGVVRDISIQKAAQEETLLYTRSLENLHRITTNTELGIDEKISSVLDYGQQFFELPLGIVSKVTNDKYTVEYIVGPKTAPPVGTEFDLGNTYCFHTLQAGGPIGFHHAGQSEIANHPCYLNFGLEAYIGTPLIVGDKLYGTLNFSSPIARAQPFKGSHFAIINYFAQWIGNALQQYQTNLDLQENSVLRQAILDASNYCIISTDTQGYIKTYNKGAQKLLGYLDNEVVDKLTLDVFHDVNEISAQAKLISKSLNKPINPSFEVLIAKSKLGLADENEWTYICKDGKRIPVLLSVNALRNSQNVITGYLGIARDITETKKVEKLKSEFISTVSHELRTPLTSIRGALSLVLNKLSHGLDKKSYKMLEMAERNSVRLTLLINDILDLEKIESKGLEFQLNAVDLIQLAKQAKDANDGFSQRHKIGMAIRTNLDSAVIWGDENRLLQVFTNLISNAVKFSPPNNNVEIRVDSHDKRFRVSVHDNGGGIPKEFHSRIFKRFAQADSSDARDKGGTGLGLSISKAIIERLDGKIDFISSPGKGTTFYFDLPKYYEIVKHPNNSPDAARALICEDNADVAKVLATILEQEGLVSDISTTVSTAATLLSEHKYRLLLLDLTLPDADGLELIRDLRKNDNTRELPVIVVSGRANEGKKEFSGEALTVIDWLQKPLDKNRFQTALRHALQGDNNPKILHIEDDLDIIQIAKEIVEDIAEYHFVRSCKDARQRLSADSFDLVILDLALSDGSGIDLLEMLKDCCPVVIFSGQESSVEVNSQVIAALNKSNTTNEQLLKTVKRALIQTQELA